MGLLTLWEFVLHVCFSILLQNHPRAVHNEDRAPQRGCRVKLSQGTSGRTKGALKSVPASWLADDSTCPLLIIRVRHHEATR